MKIYSICCCYFVIVSFMNENKENTESSLRINLQQSLVLGLKQ